MRDDARTTNRGWKALVGLALIAVAGLVGWTLYAGIEPGGDDPSEPPAFAGFEPGDGLQPSRAPDLAPEDGQGAGEATTKSQATIIRQKLRPRARELDAGRDAGAQAEDAGDAAGSADGFEWRDPANQKMLGRPTWMATPSDAESQAIDEAFERPDRERYPIDLQERRLGVEFAKDIVQSCFERLKERAPQARGRVSVAFDLVVDGRRARFRNVEIPANVDLDDPGFEACITRDLSRASFRSAEQGVMHVEYPFFFDASPPSSHH